MKSEATPSERRYEDESGLLVPLSESTFWAVSVAVRLKSVNRLSKITSAQE